MPLEESSVWLISKKMQSHPGSTSIGASSRTHDGKQITGHMNTAHPPIDRLPLEPLRPQQPLDMALPARGHRVCPCTPLEVPDPRLPAREPGTKLYPPVGRHQP